MNILVIDDQSDIRYALEKVLSKNGHTVYLSDGFDEEIEETVRIFEIDLIVLDMVLGQKRTGLEILQRLKESGLSKVPVILITAYATPSNIINASKYGIVECIEKPFGSKQILEAIEKHETQRESCSPENRAETEEEEFVGSLQTMGAVYKMIGKASMYNKNILIYGERGTGKKSVAKMIHQISGLTGSLQIVDCMELNEGRFDEVMFGTPSRKKGCIQEAEGGTLLLNGISELSLSAQSRLFRFLKERHYRECESGEEKRFFGKVIACSRYSPHFLIEEKGFREDLYELLSEIEIYVPNLEERGEDIEALSRFFLRLANRRYSLDVQGIEEEAIAFLRDKPMPNNLRGLKKIIQGAALNVRKGVIRREDLFAFLQGESITRKELEILCARILDSYGIENASRMLVDFEKTLLRLLLRRTGNLSLLARSLSISRNTLKSKLHKYGLEPGTVGKKG
jgi:DNA-binding NtrC family response regulator